LPLFYRDDGLNTANSKTGTIAIGSIYGDEAGRAIVGNYYATPTYAVLRAKVKV
jgi:hypothetical protein